MHQFVNDLQHTIESDPEILGLMREMFKEVPQHPRFAEDPLGKPRANNYHELLEKFDTTIAKAPEWNGKNPGVKCLTFSALLNWPLSTASERACFRNEKVNACIRSVFAAWADFLDSERSANILNDSPQGWFCASAPGTHHVRHRRPIEQTFCRRIRLRPPMRHGKATPPGIPFSRDRSVPVCVLLRHQTTRMSWSMPVELPPFRLVAGVQSHDTFWLKEQPLLAAEYVCWGTRRAHHSSEVPSIRDF